MATPCFHCQAPLEAHYKACPSCGEPISDFLREHLTRPIDGKYEILSRLGVGGMGEVFKVRHIHLNAIRVIKLMRPQVAQTKGAHERFVREAQLATRIQHPNVATLHDFASLPDGSFYMVWEYIDGHNLAQLIRSKGSLAPAEAARISIEALSGLQAIHDAGVVHRDVSPENVMLTMTPGGEERVKIIDLGIAKEGAGGSNATETGMFVGKWKYCSPEHLGILPDGERIDGRADLYSFGIVMYEMLAGRPPFELETPHQYVIAHTRDVPKALDLHALGAPELEKIIFRALEKDRERRFASAREMIAALRSMVPALGTAPLPATPGATTAMEQAPTVAASLTTPRPAIPPTVISQTNAISAAAAPIVATAQTHLAGYREKLGPKILAFFRTPVGKLTAIILFLGFVALVLPTVVVIIKWALITAFVIFALVASWKLYQWYRARENAPR
jgi:serine/threonine-protein kinase